jgi:hypothetical protein
MTNTKTINEIVQIDSLIDTDGTPVFLMKIANVPIRPYITNIEANKVANYMKKIVDTIIQKINIDKNLTGKDLVNIEQLPTKVGTFYLLTIADLGLRCYIDGFEASVHMNFLIGVVDEVIKQSSLQTSKK